MYSPRGGNLWVRAGARENGGERGREREGEKERGEKITRQTDLCFFPHFYFWCRRTPFSLCNSSYQPWSANKAISQRRKQAECCWPALHPQFLSHLLVLVRTLFFSFHSMSITCCCQLPLVAHGDFTSKSFIFGRKELVFSHRTTSWILHVYSRPGQLTAELTKTRAWSFMSPALSALCWTVFLFVLVLNPVLIYITILVKAIMLEFFFLCFYFALILSLLKNYKVNIRCRFVIAVFWQC